MGVETGTALLIGSILSAGAAGYTAYEQGQQGDPKTPELPKPKTEDPRELAIRRKELERRRTDAGSLRINPTSGAAGSLAVPAG